MKRTVIAFLVGAALFLAAAPWLWLAGACDACAPIGRFVFGVRETSLDDPIEACGIEGKPRCEAMLRALKLT